MANLFTLSGRNEMLDQMVGHVNDPIDAIGLSNLASIAAATTTIAAASFKQVNAINATVGATSQLTTIAADFTSAQITGNEVILITLHKDGAGTSTGVIAGQDSQSLTYSNVDVQIQATIGLATGP
jgi:hypothetical protein